jgi:hypothetical protein
MADQAEVDHKGAEGQAGVGADEDVGRVADEGGGAPHVAGKYLGNEEIQGVHLQGDRDLDGHRDDQQHGGDVVQKGRDHRGEKLQHKGQHKDVAPGPGVGLVGQELEHARFLQNPHEDHHAHEQEDDVHVDGPDGVLIRKDEVALVENPGGVADKEQQNGAQQGRQGPVHPFQGNDDIDPEEDQGGDPEGRGDGPLHGEVAGGLEQAVAGRVGSRVHHLEGRGRYGLPGGLVGLHFHPGAGEGPGGKGQIGHKAALFTGDYLPMPVLPSGLIRLPVHQDFHLRLFYPFACGGLDNPGQGQAVAGCSGRGGLQRRGGQKSAGEQDNRETQEK